MRRHLRIDKLDSGYVACEYRSDGYPGKEYGLSLLSELHVLIDKLFGESEEAVTDADIIPVPINASDFKISINSTSDDLQFHVVEAFESSTLNQMIQLPKHNIEIGEAGKIRIYYAPYKINIYTTRDEILRILKLDGSQRKELLRRFGQVAYANKAAVLRALLDVPDLEKKLTV